MDKKVKDYFVDMVFKNIRIIYKICHLYAKESEKKDLQQEIIYQLWKSFPSFKGEAKFQTWMYRVALNTALLGLRARNYKQTELSDNEKQIPYLSYVNDEKNLQIQQLYHHISKLNDIDKAIIFLYLEQYNYKEISEIMGISIKNVSVRLVRIKKKLKIMFNNKKDIKYEKG